MRKFLLAAAAFAALLVPAQAGNPVEDSYILRGSTSGTVTIKPPAVTGTVNLTTPTGSGTIAATALSPITLDPTTGQIACPTCSTSGGITALTGDVTASGTGSAAATLATVNSTPGTFQGLTVNAKGLVTAAAAQSYLTAPVAYSSLTTLTANSVLGALTATTPSALAVPSCADSSGNHLNYVSGTGFSCGTSAAAAPSSGAGSGTVTSVALSAPADETITGSPITSAGTLTITRNAQTANTFEAGPASGAAASPAYRSLVAADIPATTVSPGSYTLSSITVGADGRLTAASSGTGGGSATNNELYPVAWQTGRSYGPYITTTPGNVSLSSSLIYGCPIYVPTALTLKKLSINVTNAPTGTGRLGVYTNTAGQVPGTLVSGSDGGDVTSVSDANSSATLTASLTAGTTYWLAFMTSSATPLWSGYSTNSQQYVAAFGSIVASNVFIVAGGPCVTASQTYGAMPGSFPGTLSNTNSEGPYIVVSF